MHSEPKPMAHPHQHHRSAHTFMHTCDKIIEKGKVSTNSTAYKKVQELAKEVNYLADCPTGKQYHLSCSLPFIWPGIHTKKLFAKRMNMSTR